MKEQYPSVEQRMIDTCIETFPPFTPDAGAPVPEDAQRAFHGWVLSLYRTLGAQPSLLFAKLHDDGVFTYRFNRAHDKTPKLDAYMRAATKRIDALLELLFALGAQARIEDGRMVCGGPPVPVAKAQRAALQACGVLVEERDGQTAVKADANVLEAWRWMASRPGAAPFALSHCLFNARHNYAADVYAELMGDERALRWLVRQMEERGYTRIDNRDDGIALDYVKDYGARPTPVKEAWGEREHGGVSFKYYGYVARPACLCLRVPRFKSLLERFGDMEPALRAFILKNSKKCDGCGYCTQTDKAGTRKPLVFAVSDGGEETRLCPLFPGFYFCWDAMDMELAENCVNFLAFIDGAFGG